MLVSSGACETGRDAQEGLQQVLVRVREAAALTRDVGHLLVDELQHAYNLAAELHHDWHDEHVVRDTVEVVGLVEGVACSIIRSERRRSSQNSIYFSLVREHAVVARGSVPQRCKTS